MMWSDNRYLNSWIQEVATLCQPDATALLTGSPEEMKKLEEALVLKQALIPLSSTLRPHSFLARSNPDDVARVEDRTFICSLAKEDAGPTNNWKDPQEMKKSLNGLFAGCMRGRTLYVVPFCMGPLSSPYSRVAVQITDSPYVVLNMHLMTRVGLPALEVLKDNPFVKCLHSVGKPIVDAKDEADSWPCNPKELCIAHFPEEREVWSFGSGYGGNALLNKKCFALRIASKMARDEGWLAEHMLIIGLTNPEGKKRYFAASFPSACGKTNLAMLTSCLPGWKVECVGDDIAWLNWAADGTLRAINPEAGFFGVAPGTSFKSNPNAMLTIRENTLFTNVALTDEGDVWWEGMTDAPPKHLISWTGADWTSQSRFTAAQANARFTVHISQCPIIDPAYDAAEGVPISGIIFGGRRATTHPLVREALNWSHGVFLGASMTSETTAAAAGELGRIRHDPFSMLPFCGYNMGDYFAHWLSMEKKGRKLPKIFYVNWFQKDGQGKFIWPGFADNIRVLKWMFERVEDSREAKQTPIGLLPKPEDLDLSGLKLQPELLQQLLAVNPAHWKKEASELSRYFALFGDRLPEALSNETVQLQKAFL
ncbi:MAG: phosphoenolpyruvate carboxykinase (GTP) [Verrucomicrobia bacterium]|nr:phosphoenolpyruvate carboxykinase (GTP) [Verrucomicrobiota bacterium]